MATQFSLRPATPDDACAVTAMLQASYPVLMAAGYDDAMLALALPLMTRANPTLLASGTFYVAETQDGAFVGCGGWTFEHPGSGMKELGLAHIRHFGTHADWTGRGVGRAIFERCLSDARSSGAERFQCYSSLNAEGFYAVMGFKAVRRETVRMSDDLMLPVIHMECPIPDDAG